MAFSREHFLRYRPYLYHYTSEQNVVLLQKTRELRSAAAWVKAANAFRAQVKDVQAFLGEPRFEPINLEVAKALRVILNDQRPLRSKKSFAALRGTHNDYLRCLNDLVFFWPGDESGPTPKGSLAESFARRYAQLGCIRAPTAHLWHEGTPPLFCRCNSGAPQARDRIERGPHIFIPNDDHGLATREVAEVVFRCRIALPETTEWRPPQANTWRTLWATD